MKTDLDARLIQGLVPRLRLFCDVAPLGLAPLIRQSSVITAPRGMTVASHGTRLPGVFGLAYGSVKISLHGQDSEERVLRLVSPGETFGEAHALLGRACSGDATALAESKLIVIPAAAIFALMERDGRFARALAMALAERSVELLGEVEAAMQRGEQRLAAYLGSLPEAGGNGSGGTMVRLPVSKTVVAARLGMQKETLSRLLARLAREGLIEVSRREIAILDRPRLARLTLVPAAEDEVR